ncbi:HAD family hydrolase [Candidatus Gottesmanbacteria bacterium]|nr:HAD family hydrolase [Candidatus Gottesmanbacteria bacterium]
MKKSPKKKLVLFDIDGTLVDSSAKSVGHWKERITAVFERVYETPVTFEIDVHEYNGKVDKQVFLLIAEKLGITKETFNMRFDKAKEVYHGELKRVLLEEETVYVAFPDAKSFVESLKDAPDIAMGVITGNIERNAWAKLKKAGIDGLFNFGAFADEVESREALVTHALEKANSHFGVPFAREDVVIIGDTVHDIRAAKFGGVRSIGVSTGTSTTHEGLLAEGADLVVSSLMDKRVFDLLGLTAPTAVSG